MAKLQSIENRGEIKHKYGSGFCKPRFPKLPSDIFRDLDFYIGDDLWAFFNILRINTSFLKEPAETWNNNKAYQNAQLVVDNIKVVNDSAERGVKLVQDFHRTARKETHFQNILQTVENSRKYTLNQRNHNVKPSSWYLTLWIEWNNYCRLKHLSKLFLSVLFSVFFFYNFFFAMWPHNM